MRRRYANEALQDIEVTKAALDALGANELRVLLLELVPWLDEPIYSRLANTAIDQAARNQSGWTPNAPSPADIAAILTFTESACHMGQADPADVDRYLRQGNNAFLNKNYQDAAQVFAALLPPLCDGDIDLGQDEMVEDVLGVDLADCVAQHLVSSYLLASPEFRAEAVFSAIDETSGIGHFWQPLRELERVAIEPLPGFDAFLQQWQAFLENRFVGDRLQDWDNDEDRWQREVVFRLEGVEGLSRVARASKKASDLDAWCKSLVEGGDWQTALSAYDEAARLVDEAHQARGLFLDGAALSAQQLGRGDFDEWLKRAWQTEPTFLRLCRWLGTSKNATVLRARVTEALLECPKKALRQRGLLLVFDGAHKAAAELLADASGLGWSDSSHPGHLLFSLFCRCLGHVPMSEVNGDQVEETDYDWNRHEPRLAVPDLIELFSLAEVATPVRDEARVDMLKAMRRAAEKRLAGVTENQRRRHYGHAAALAITCCQIARSAEASSWLSAIRQKYRRYSALQREFAQHGPDYPIS